MDNGLDYAALIPTRLTTDYANCATDAARKASSKPLLKITKKEVDALEHLSVNSAFLRPLLSDRTCWGKKPVPMFLNGFFNKGGYLVAAAKRSLINAFHKLNIQNLDITYAQLEKILKAMPK